MLRALVIFFCLSFGCLTARTAYDKPYSHEFFAGGGFTHCRMNFIDAGLRYYHWRNDGQTFLAFGGVTTGCEFSLKQPQQIYIPYLGWQGHVLTVAYGLRGEYATDREQRSYSLAPEVGWSFFECVRITAGYRWVLTKNDPLQLQGFRFSLFGAIPLSALARNGEED
jgi:hypothetical protein